MEYDFQKTDWIGVENNEVLSGFSPDAELTAILTERVNVEKE